MASKQSLRAQVPKSTRTRHNLASLVVSFVDVRTDEAEAKAIKRCFTDVQPIGKQHNSG